MNIEECKTGLEKQVPKVVESGSTEFLVGLRKGGELAELWTKQALNLCPMSAKCPNTAVSSGDKGSCVSSTG